MNGQVTIPPSPSPAPRHLFVLLYLCQHELIAPSSRVLTTPLIFCFTVFIGYCGIGGGMVTTYSQANEKKSHVGGAGWKES